MAVYFQNWKKPNNSILISSPFLESIFSLIDDDRCYMEAGNFKDALSLLEKSLKMNKQVLGEDDVNNGEIYTE